MNAADRQLAAEYALGVLDDLELADARRRFVQSAEIRAEVDGWSARLAPLLDDVEPVEAAPGVWARIESALPVAVPGVANDNHLRLRRSRNGWRAATAAMTALAAGLAIVIVGRPVQVPPPAAPSTQSRTAPLSAPPMVAMVGNEAGTKLVANWDPVQRRLVLAVAGDMPADPGRSHELWVIPAGGSPRSLGTMPGGKMMHMDLADALAELLEQGATIAVTVEPAGGSPSGAPTGPMVASGTLENA